MSSVSGTGTITSAGVGSGLDVESIVTKLVAIESQPITTLKTAESKLNTKLSEWGKVKSALSDLNDAAQKLTLPSTWNITKATSSDTSSVNVSTDANAVAGSYSIAVTSLATAQTLASAAQTSATATLGSGTLHIKAGTAAAIDVSISSTDTLKDIASKINSASSTVKASVVTDATGTRLVMRGTTGAANTFTVTADDGDGDNTDASGLSALAYDPSSSVTQMTQTQAAANSAATINGLTVTGTSNTITAIDGLTITLSKLTSAVDVTVKPDTDSISTSVNDFVKAYNSLQSLLAADTKYDAGTKTAGTLQGDNTAVSLQNQIRSLMGGASSASSTFTRMSDIGLAIQDDGSVKVDSTKLSSALGNLSEVKKMFTTYAGTGASASDGFGQRFRVYSSKMLGVDGAVTTRTDGIQKSIDSNEKRQTQLQDMVDAYEKRIRAQYTALDSAMATLNTQSSYISQMITAWNKG